MNILTFDIEDWFHLLEVPETKELCRWDRFTPRIHKNVEKIMDALERKNVRATFFCLGWVAEKYPEVVKMIDIRGHEIGSHSYSHGLVSQHTRKSFIEDLHRSISVIEGIINKKVTMFRAPGFSVGCHTPWFFDSIIDQGINCDSSVFPASHGHGGYPGFVSSTPCIIKISGKQIMEFPVNTFNIFGWPLVYSGGGYFRVLPYFVIRELTRRSHYVMAYFHPRDFDPDQPRLKLSTGRLFKSYVGLRESQIKFERWIIDNKFIDLSTAITQIDWDSVPEIEIE